MEILFESLIHFLSRRNVLVDLVEVRSNLQRIFWERGQLVLREIW